jgi:hypothetical protein
MKLFIACIVSVFVLAAPPGVMADASSATYKCKDTGHVRNVAYASGPINGVGMTSVTSVTHPHCVNPPNFPPRVFAVSVGHHHTLRLLPTLAAVMELQMLAATRSVSIEATVDDVFVTWESLTLPAAHALGSQLRAAGA